MRKSTAEDIYSFLVEDEDARVCQDIPEEACDEQPAAFVRQLLAQTLTKLGDALSSSRLVLAWMLASIAAPAMYIALLVPLRESLSLLPQLFIAQWIREHAIRKWFWVAGSAAQGLALAAMIPALLLLPGESAGLVIVVLLAVFSLARGVCSVAAKDVLGKTVSKFRRGRLTGLAASAAGLVTLIVAVFLWLAPGAGSGQDDRLFFAALLGLSAVLWFGAALVYAGIPEVPGATEGGGNAFTEALRSLGLLRTDRDLRRFVLARVLLVATAFAIPYLVVLLQRQGGAGIGGLAGLLLAEGAAGLLSGHIWGRWSDRSSHRVMAAAASCSAAVIAATLLCYYQAPQLLAGPAAAAALVFAAAVAHQGARIGRKTYLVDLATADNRASYVAVSNTVVGVFLLCGSGLGAVDALFGTATVLLALFATCVLATAFCLSLKAVD